MLQIRYSATDFHWLTGHRQLGYFTTKGTKSTKGSNANIFYRIKLRELRALCSEKLLI